MKISKKLYAIFSFIVVLAFSISLFSLSQLVKMNDQYTDLIENRLEQIYMAADLQSRVGVQGVHLRQYVLTGNPDSLKSLQGEQQRIETNLVDLEKTVVTEKMRDLMDQLTAARDQFNVAAEKVIREVDAGDTDAAIATLASEVRNANLGLNDTSEEMLTYHKEVFDSTSTKTGEDVETSTVVFTILTLLIVVMSVGSVIVIRRTIIKPLNQITQQVEIIASGDLTQEVMVVHSQDEIGTLTKSVNEMKGTMNALISAANDNALELAAISQQLNVSTAQVSQTSQQISENVEVITVATQGASQIANDTSVAMEENASGVQNIAESIQTIHSDANVAGVLATQGEKAILTAKEQMQSIYVSSKVTTELIQSLSKSSMEIQSISKVIEDITDQTNLLALNAAIEAARAGDHGKGFAVVADEVRKLAEQSKASAGLINNLTAHILEETQHVEKSVNDGLSQVETGVEVIEEAGKSFTEITSAVGGTVVRIAEVSAVTEEMSASTEQISASVMELSQNAQESASQTSEIAQQIEEQSASMQEIHAIANNLDNKSQELAGLIAQFKVNR